MTTEPLSHATEFQDSHTQAGCVSDQVRGLVCHDRSKRCILPCLHPSPTQEVTEVRIWGRSVAILSSSLPPGRTAFTPFTQADAPDPSVVSGQAPLAESSSYSWSSQCRSRHFVETGAEARGMDTSPWGGEGNMESVWPCSIGPLCNSGDIAMSPLVLSDSSSSTGTRRYGADLASSVRISPNCSAPGSSGESAPGRGQSTAGSTILAGPSMVLGPDFSP